MVALSPEEIKRREFLLSKFKDKHTTVDEVKELQRLLEEEEEEAVDAGKFMVVIGIGFLLGLIAAFLSEEENKKKKKKKRFFIF